MIDLVFCGSDLHTANVAMKGVLISFFLAGQVPIRISTRFKMHQSYPTTNTLNSPPCYQHSHVLSDAPVFMCVSFKLVSAIVATASKIYVLDYSRRLFYMRRSRESSEIRCLGNQGSIMMEDCTEWFYKSYLIVTRNTAKEGDDISIAIARRWHHASLPI